MRPELSRSDGRSGGQVLRLFASLPPCLIENEACATAHHRSRELQRLGRQVRLMPPASTTPIISKHYRGRTDLSLRNEPFEPNFTDCPAKRRTVWPNERIVSKNLRANPRSRRIS